MRSKESFFCSTNEQRANCGGCGQLCDVQNLHEISGRRLGEHSVGFDAVYFRYAGIKRLIILLQML